MNLVNATSLVYLKQYLDSKSKLDGKIRESHEYTRLINPCKKNQPMYIFLFSLYKDRRG